MKKLIVIVSLFMCISLNHAQTNPEDKLGISYEFGTSNKISEKISIDTYTLLWLYKINDNFNFILLNAGLNYRINSNVTASVAYGYSDFDATLDTSTPHTLEHRISEHLVFKHKFVNLPIAHRLKLEHRFLRNSISRQTVTRLRYRLGTKFKLNNTLFIFLKDELLLSPKLSNTPENRFNSGLGININKSSAITLGYFNRNTIKKLNLHRLQVALFIKTDLRKK